MRGVLGNDRRLDSQEKILKEALLHKSIIHILLIIIVGLIAYSNTFNVPFQFDDNPNIVENYKLRNLSNLWPPSGSRWFGFFTFALNYYFGGLNTIGYHIVNLIIHILNAILVYWLVVLTFKTPYFLNITQNHQGVIARSEATKQSHDFEIASPLARNDNNLLYSSKFTILIALFSALIFVVHPIQTQAVTYIVQRFTSLTTFFYLLSLVMYIKFRMQDTRYRIQDTPLNPPLVGGELKGGGASCIVHHASEPKLHAKRYTLYAISLISAIFAMKTKEISFTLPFIIILYEFCFFSKSPDSDPESSSGRTMNLRRLLYLMPFLLTLFIIPLSLIGIDKPIGDAIGELREAAQETEEISRWSYLLTQFRVIVTYIRLLFLPINQNLDYDYPVFHSFLGPQVFLSFLFLLSIFGIALYLLCRSRISHPEPKAKGLRDSSATPQTCPERDDEILPLNQVQGQNDRKRRNDINIPTRYPLPPTRLIAFGIFWFFITLSVESSIIPIKDVIFEHRVYLPSVGAIIAFSIAIFYGLQFSVHRSRIFTSYFPLPTSYFLLLSTIVVTLSIATYQRNIIWQDEVSLWEDVVKKSPEKARGHNNLGIIYRERGWADNAIEHYQIALKLNPNNASTHNNMGNAYYAKEWLDKSIQEYKTAIKLNPEHTEAHNNIGIAYHKQGHLDEAIQEYKMVLKLKPDCAVAHYNLGNAYKAKEWLDKSIQEYKTAIKLNPDYAEAHNNIGTAYEKKELLDEAIKEYQTALRLNPKDEVARNNLNRILHIKSK